MQHNTTPGTLPAPCRTCPVYLHRQCCLQELCACSNAWYRARREELLRHFLAFLP